MTRVKAGSTFLAWAAPAGTWGTTTRAGATCFRLAALHRPMMGLATGAGSDATQTRWRPRNRPVAPFRVNGGEVFAIEIIAAPDIPQGAVTAYSQTHAPDADNSMTSVANVAGFRRTLLRNSDCAIRPLAKARRMGWCPTRRISNAGSGVSAWTRFHQAGRAIWRRRANPPKLARTRTARE